MSVVDFGLHIVNYLKMHLADKVYKRFDHTRVSTIENFPPRLWFDIVIPSKHCITSNVLNKSCSNLLGSTTGVCGKLWFTYVNYLRVHLADQVYKRLDHTRVSTIEKFPPHLWFDIVSPSMHCITSNVLDYFWLIFSLRR